MNHLLSILTIFLFSFNTLFSQVINVPGDQPTIQSGIEAATDGDTVLVADGRYYENINFKGKAITVASWFLIDGDETHIDSTIIDGSQPSDPKKGTVVKFNSGEDTTSVLFGLTITGGTGTYNPNAPHPNVWGAGGIAINSGAKIIHNKIINNSVTGTHQYAYGGGILVESPTKPIQIVNNIIANNSVIGISEEEGGGGGIFCVFINNTDIFIANNLIKNNSVVSTLNELKGSGGGINYTHSTANPNVRNNLMFNNSARLGGAIKFTAYTSDNNPSLINNTITNNIATVNGGGIYSEESLTVINSIIWGNTAPINPQLTTSVLVEWSDVEGGWEGKGNIDLDPIFADTINFYLDPSSPCVDGGSPYLPFADNEDPLNPNLPLSPSLGNLRNDMGAYGGHLYTISSKVDRTVHVPKIVNNIQEAINASQDGDTVLVADGRYYENINFMGKAITVASWFIIDGDETHIDSTIIDGSQSTHPIYGSVVTFESGEDTNSVLCGFTITGGKGNIDMGHAAGGGIASKYSGGKIIFNKIIYNKLNYSASVGGGIVVYNPISTFIISNNIIAYNEERSTVYTGGGGGIHVGQDRFRNVIIMNNYIAHNESSSANIDGRGAGGGIDLNQSVSIIRNNIIVFNKAYQGGGIDIFYGNIPNGPIIENNTIAFNHVTSEIGGGIIGGIDGPADKIKSIKNCILWGNTAGETLNQIGKSDARDSELSVEYSLIQGGYDGTANIDQDPIFTDTSSFLLDNSSPCIDGGNRNVSFNDVDDENNIGFALFPAQGGLRNDMGAFGGPYSKWPFIEIPTDIKTDDNIIPKSINLSQNYPNPFNPSTKISYSIPHQSYVILKIFDVLGREVEVLVNNEQSIGNYEVEFDGSELTSGIYFYRIQAGDYVETRKMILMK